MKLSAQFLRFAAVGAAGFLVDVGVLYALHYLGLDLYLARLLSFLAAATFTWLGNRRFTFAAPARRAARLGGEWASYVAAMGLGGLVNYGTYAVLITLFELFRAQPWLAVAAGTGAGLAVNFVTARHILHRPGA
jgi:putative flippase GtrA